MRNLSAQSERTIRSSIRRNNSITIFLILIIVFFSTGNLICVDVCQNRQAYYTRQQNDVNSVLLGQQKWLWQLNDSIYNGTSFSDAISAQDCSFGKWAAAHQNLEPELKSGFNTANGLHQQLHELASQTLELSKTDTAAAADLLNMELIPLFDNMNQGAQAFAAFYAEKADGFHFALIGFIIFAICSNVILFFVAWFAARKLGDRLSQKVSNPITAVAKWSEELSNGSADLEFDSDLNFDCDLKEINTMIRSFKAMAESIEENVRVVQKVADGDMTAFVNIRSASDSLGKNLYRMVQSNDLMFAEISQIAQSVSQGAEGISRASSSLADSCNVQSQAVQQFRSAIEETSQSIHSNNEQATEAETLSKEIHAEIQDSKQKMSQLLQAMKEIRQASERVTTMIASIEEISSQTNLLALNAAIEAARAGIAGKGFAVVADEVKNLAAKSAQAADESKQLVEDTSRKAALGDTLSKEASESFGKITESIYKITNVTDIISQNSAKQATNIAVVEDSIQEIAGVIDANAAASQQAASESAELRQSSFALKEAMNKFNLRKREPGKPYIPPEKRNDPEFIRQAEENYRKALQKGKIVQPGQLANAKQALPDGY